MEMPASTLLGTHRNQAQETLSIVATTQMYSWRTSLPAVFALVSRAVTRPSKRLLALAALVRPLVAMRAKVV